MNPEFKRNLWLEISPTRLLLMAGVLGLIFTITWFAGPADYRSTSLTGVAQGVYGVIVGVWGSFKTGRSVSDEIRERTWDFQRLSALSPMAMTLGKLFGATAYVWFGGLICLAVSFWSAAQTLSLGQVIEDTGKLLLAGVFAHAVALFVSLAAVRRGRGRDRIDAFVYTVAGIFAFNAGNTVSGRTFDWLRAMENPGALPASALDWWGLPVGEDMWAFISLGTLTLWAVATAWRLMRVELQAPANPLWFPLFLLAPAVIFAGTLTDAFGRVVLAYFIIHLLVLLVLLAEPKDVVSWRALVARRGTRGAGRYWPSALSGLIVAFLAAGAVAVAYVATGSKQAGASPLLGFAAFAFLLRETAIFAFFHLGANQRRGDFAALLTIALLCIAGPTVLGIANLQMATGLFIVQPDGGMMSHLLSIASGLVQAAVFGVLAQARWSGREKALAVA
jgi:hypothetical protein